MCPVPRRLRSSRNTLPSSVYLCRRADFGIFYVGHTGRDPAPYLPRYEFLDSLRSRGPGGGTLWGAGHERSGGGEAGGEAADRVAENVRRIVEALDHTRLAIDGDHNFASHKRLVKIIPYVVHRAHEAC